MVVVQVCWRFSRTILAVSVALLSAGRAKAAAGAETAVWKKRLRFIVSSGDSVQIDIALHRTGVWIFLGALEEFVELLLEHFAVRLLGLEGFSEHFFAAGALALQ